MKAKELDWVNISILVGTPVLTIVFLALHFQYEEPRLILWVLLLVSFFLVGSGITGGYHRLFAHKAYTAHPAVKLFYLLFGAAAYENSALKWCSDHRRHHRHVDTENDPYNIKQGFFHAHMGWVFYKDTAVNLDFPADLESDPLIQWQHKYYIPIAIAVGVVLPFFIGLWIGTPLGGIAILVLLRTVLVHHFTFFINSLAHTLGKQPFSDKNSSKDNFLTALLSHGEGYHNFHHTFQHDYRNGYRWYHWDPTKWLINAFSAVGLCTNLNRTNEAQILKARMDMMEKKALSNVSRKELLSNKLALWRSKVEEAQNRLSEIRAEYYRLKQSIPAQSRERIHMSQEKLREFRVRIREAKRDFQIAYETWIRQIQALSISPAV